MDMRKGFFDQNALKIFLEDYFTLEDEKLVIKDGYPFNIGSGDIGIGYKRFFECMDYSFSPLDGVFHHNSGIIPVINILDSEIHKDEVKVYRFGKMLKYLTDLLTRLEIINQDNVYTIIDSRIIYFTNDKILSKKESNFIFDNDEKITQTEIYSKGIFRKLLAVSESIDKHFSDIDSEIFDNSGTYVMKPMISPIEDSYFNHISTLILYYDNHLKENNVENDMDNSINMTTYNVQNTFKSYLNSKLNYFGNAWLLSIRIYIIFILNNIEHYININQVENIQTTLTYNTYISPLIHVYHILKQYKVEDSLKIIQLIFGNVIYDPGENSDYGDDEDIIDIILNEYYNTSLNNKQDYVKILIIQRTIKKAKDILELENMFLAYRILLKNDINEQSNRNFGNNDLFEGNQDDINLNTNITTNNDNISPNITTKKSKLVNSLYNRKKNNSGNDKKNSAMVEEKNMIFDNASILNSKNDTNQRYNDKIHQNITEIFNEKNINLIKKIRILLKKI